MPEIPADLTDWTWERGCLRRISWPCYLAPYHADPFSIAREMDAHAARLAAERAERHAATAQQRSRKPKQSRLAASIVQEELDL